MKYLHYYLRLVAHLDWVFQSLLVYGILESSRKDSYLHNCLEQLLQKIRTQMLSTNCPYFLFPAALIFDGEKAIRSVAYAITMHLWKGNGNLIQAFKVTSNTSFISFLISLSRGCSKGENIKAQRREIEESVY